MLTFFNINNKSIFHVINKTICFQINRRLKNILTKHLWKQIRFCWIDTYLELFDFISIDAEKQFIIKKFRQYAFNIKITVKHVFVETHYSIDQIERYHASFCRIYTIIITKILNIDLTMTLQIIFKIINYLMDFNELIFTLFVFDVYFCMNELNAFFSALFQRATAICKIMNEIKRFIVSRQINNISNTRNKFSTIAMHDFSLNSSILMFWKNIANHANTWQKSYNY